MSKEPTYKGTFFEQFVNEGYQKGWHNGWQEGRQKGRIEGAMLARQADLIAYLTDRWPTLALDTIAETTLHADIPTINAAQRFVWNSVDSTATRTGLLEILKGRREGTNTTEC